MKYTCPMHPEIISNKPGKCPKCRMDLVSKETSLAVVGFKATLHCMTGCAAGEILGMALGSIFSWPNIETVVVSIALAFLFGYSLTLIPLLQAAISFKRALVLAFATDTLSITIMEIVDNLVMFYIPGAMDAHITSSFFWGSLILSLVLAFIFAYPMNIYLISKGKGHATTHKH